MIETPQLYLVTPVLSDIDPVLPALIDALGGAAVAAVLLRLERADERTLVNRVKAAADAVHRRGAALIVAADGAGAAGLAVRGGADGLHVDGSAVARASREALPADRSLGVGGLKTRDEAMEAGEAGADYVMFGEPRPDGYVPPLAGTTERAEWWASIFETPCVAYAETTEAADELGRTGAEFVAVGEWAWGGTGGPETVRRIAAGFTAFSGIVPA